MSQEQNEKLQTKRYERSNTNTDPQTAIQNRPVNPPGFRSSSDLRTNPTVRVTPTDVPVRSSFRTSTPAASGTQNNSQPQTVRRGVTTESTPAPRTNPSSVRQSVPTPTFVPRRTETPPTPTRK